METKYTCDGTTCSINFRKLNGLVESDIVKYTSNNEEYYHNIKPDTGTNTEMPFKVMVNGSPYRLKSWWNPNLVLEYTDTVTWSSNRRSGDGIMVISGSGEEVGESEFWKRPFSNDIYAHGLRCYYPGGGKPGMGKVFTLALRETPLGSDPLSEDNIKLYGDPNHDTYTICNIGTTICGNGCAPNLTINTGCVYSDSKIIPLYEDRNYYSQVDISGTIHYSTVYDGVTYEINCYTYYGYTSEG